MKCDVFCLLFSISFCSFVTFLTFTLRVIFYGNTTDIINATVFGVASFILYISSCLYYYDKTMQLDEIIQDVNNERSKFGLPCLNRPYTNAAIKLICNNDKALSAWLRVEVKTVEMIERFSNAIKEYVIDEQNTALKKKYLELSIFINSIEPMTKPIYESMDDYIEHIHFIRKWEQEYEDLITIDFMLKVLLDRLRGEDIRASVRVISRSYRDIDMSYMFRKFTSIEQVISLIHESDELFYRLTTRSKAHDINKLWHKIIK